MAIQKALEGFTDAAVSAEDLTGKEMYCITRGATGFAVSGEGAVVAGICSEGKAAGLWSSVNTGGILRVVAGGPLSVGDKVQSNSSGKAVAGSTNTFGTVRKAVSYENEIAEIAIDRLS